MMMAIQSLRLGPRVSLNRFIVTIVAILFLVIPFQSAVVDGRSSRSSRLDDILGFDNVPFVPKTTRRRSTITNNDVLAGYNDDVKEVTTGTTLLAIPFQDGVVVGADTRTSTGTYVSNRFAFKISPITPSVVLCRSGSAADTQFLALAAKREIQERQRLSGVLLSSGDEDDEDAYRYDLLPSTASVAHLVRSILLEQQSGMQVSLICAGYDVEVRTTTTTMLDIERGGEATPPKRQKVTIPRILSISPSGSIMEDGEDPGFAVSGSGSTYIMGHLDQTASTSSSSRRRTEEEAVDYVVHAVGLAMSRDGSSGGMIRIHVLSPKYAGGSKSFFVTMPTAGKKEPKTATEESSSSSSIAEVGLGNESGTDELLSNSSSGKVLPGFANAKLMN